VHNNNFEKQDGTMSYGTQITVNSFEFCESKGNASNNEPNPMPSNNDGFMNIPDNIAEELPFN
jgi:single-strand DNA-binding protein